MGLRSRDGKVGQTPEEVARAKCQRSGYPFGIFPVPVHNLTGGLSESGAPAVSIHEAGRVL